VAPNIIKTRYGSRFSIPKGSEEDLISKFILRYGEWAWDEVRFAASLVPTNGRVIDGGAYLGTFGLGLMLRKQLSRICFIEASKGAARLLKMNVESNANCEFFIECKILAGRNKFSKIGFASAGNNGSTSFANDTKGTERVVSATRSCTLLDLRKKYGRFDLIKLDIEGMERDVVFSDLFWIADKTNLLLECTESVESLNLGRHLLQLGIPIHFFAFPSYNPSNFRKNHEPIFPYAYEASLVVGPSRPRLRGALIKNRCILRKVNTLNDLKQALWETPRWGMAEWREMPPSEAAVQGRYYLKQSFEGFLN